MVKPTERRVTYTVAIGYGVTDMFGGGAFTIISAYMLFFYTTYCGLSALEAGSIFAIARVVDALLSPIMGYISDNFGNTWAGKRFGRRRFFLLVGAPLMFVYAMLWQTDMSYWYYLGTYLSIELISAMVLVPWETLAAEMTNRFSERSRLSGFRMICGAIGGFIGVSLPGLIMHITGKDSSLTYTLTGAIFAVISAAVVFISWFSTWEAKDVSSNEAALPLDEKTKSFSGHMICMFKDMLSTFRIRAFRQHLSIYILSFTAIDIFFAILSYYMVYCLNQPVSSVSFFLGISAFASIPGTFVFMIMMSKYGVSPSKAARISYIGVILTLAFLFIAYVTKMSFSPLIFSIVFFIYGFSRSGTNYIPWNVYSFIPDVDEMVTKKRREGIYAGVMVLTRKSTLAIAMLLVGVVLEESGFVKGGGAQTEQAIHAILGLMIFATGALLGISFIITYFFKLNKHTHKLLLKEIARRKLGGSSSDCDDETKVVIKQLTGYENEHVWGGEANKFPENKKEASIYN